MAADYKSTLNLPKTAFPMKADLAKREPEILAGWESLGVYALLRKERRGRETFILHDGPPYANGHIHMGTAFNKVLKDIIVKSKGLEGLDAPYVPGWDCHGLPIELQVDKEMGTGKAGMSVGDFRRRCREYASRFVDIQRDEFRRLGVFGDWQDPYLTMKFSYQAQIVRELARFFAAGSVYRGFKPVYWCLSCRTALAEAEVEYQEKTSHSVWVKFPFVRDPKGVIPAGWTEGLHALIWTTTPWTIPANLAISVHPDFEYVILDTDRGRLLVAADLAQSVARETGLRISGRGPSFPGRSLEGLVFGHPFAGRESPILVGEHVTRESGTGLVHTAPGHGQEDHEIGLRYGLPVFSPVDDEGRFTEEAPEFRGRRVFEANAGVVELLGARGMLAASGKVTHSYPHCWRCKNPVIFRATRQWFISMEEGGLRKKALEGIRSVRWIPAWGEERIYNMIENRPDWCISRQRWWGSPITVFYCASCRRMLATPEVFEHVAALFEREGADAWYEKPAAGLLPPGAVCRECGGREFEKEMDILDVWFDSGVSHAAVLEPRPELSWPSDIYLEGSDQHRGWFHSALLTAVGTRGKPPYRSVLTHGFVVDAEGKKMSKSAGNVIAPQEVIDKYGAEILRMWVAAEDYTQDIRLSMEIIQRLVDAYRRIRNTARFILGNLHDFSPDRDSVETAKLEKLDRWALARTGDLARTVRRAYGDYEFHLASSAIHQFCVVEMSSFYLDIIKDRLYIYAPDSARRRSAQTALFLILRSLVKMIVPILSFTAEEIWGYLPSFGGKEASPFLAVWDEQPAGLLSPEEEQRWKTLIEARREITRALEEARQAGTIGHSLDAELGISAPGELRGVLEGLGDTLREVLIVSAVGIAGSADGEGLKVKVGRAPGEKCQRCWTYSTATGKEPDFPGLCPRCTAIMQEARDKS